MVNKRISTWSYKILAVPQIEDQAKEIAKNEGYEYVLPARDNVS
jgi:hypothetical protein